MDNAVFKADTRYTLTWKDETVRKRSRKVHVYRVREKFMIVRETSGPDLGK